MLETKGRCNICRKVLKEDKPGIVCSQCAKAFHGQCLDPPLTTEELKVEPMWRCNKCQNQESKGSDLNDEAEEIMKNLRTVISAKEVLSVIEEALDRLLARYDNLYEKAKLLKIERAVLRREIEKMGGKYPHEMIVIVTKQYLYGKRTPTAARPILKRREDPAVKYAEVMKDFKEIADNAGLNRKEKVSYWIYGTSSIMTRRWITHLILLFFLIIITMGGAWLFVLIEANDEVAEMKNLTEAREQLLESLRRIGAASIDLTDHTEAEKHKSIVFDLVRGYEDEVIEIFTTNTKIKNLGPELVAWTYWNAVFFCSTVYTTIGYGHIVPVTSLGRMFLIVYTIIGIPLFLIMLTDYGMLLSRIIKMIWYRIHLFYSTGNFKRRKRRSSEESFISDSEHYADFNVPVTVALFILTIYLFLGAILFFFGEPWTYFGSFYFCFVSLSTLGFGDFLPTNPNIVLFSATYIVFGLALTSMCINVFRESMSSSISIASAKVESTIGDAMEKERYQVVKQIPPAEGEKRTKSVA